MKAGLIRLFVAGVMMSSVCAMAADPAPAAAPKAKESVKKVMGVLSAPAANAAAGVVAVLTHTEKDKTTTKYNLTCTDAEVVAKITDGIAKGATVIVHGEVSKDSATIAVTKCEAAKHHGAAATPAATPAAAPAAAPAADKK